MKKLHILLIRLSSLGDVVLVTSVISFLRMKYGNQVQISFLTYESYVPLLKNHPHLDLVFGMQKKSGFEDLKNLWKTKRAIQKESPVDLVFDLHGRRRTSWLRLFWWKIPALVVYKRNFRRRLLAIFKINLMDNQLVLERNIRDICTLFGFSYKREELSEFIFKEKSAGLGLSSCSLTFQENPSSFLSQFALTAKNYICLIPSASYHRKRWFTLSFIQLSEMILKSSWGKELKIVVLAGKEDLFCKDFDVLQQKYPSQFINLQGKTNLEESTRLMKTALFFIGNDTGLSHIGEALQTPGVFLMGPSSEKTGYRPHLKTSVLAAEDLWCRPCLLSGNGCCIRSEQFCFTLMTPAKVFDHVTHLQQTIKVSS